METLGPSVTQIKSALGNNQHVRLVGELEVFSLTYSSMGGSVFKPGARRDFYVEPITTPVFGALTDSQVDTLNAAVYHKKRPTRELLAIPRQFAEAYNQIFKEMLPSEFPEAFGTLNFQFGPAGVSLGEKVIIASDPVGTVSKRVETKFVDPRMQELAKTAIEVPLVESSENMKMEVWVRLFPTGMGRLVHEYETGYYLNGNVVQWDQSENNNLVYKGRYISIDSLTPSQLQALVRGEVPFPKVEYLDKSVFEGDPDKVKDILMRRLTSRDNKYGPFRMFANADYIMGSSKEFEYGNFDEVSYDAQKSRDGDTSVFH